MFIELPLVAISNVITIHKILDNDLALIHIKNIDQNQ